MIKTLQKIRKKRNKVAYDALGHVTETELGEAIAIAEELNDSVGSWLWDNHPNLVR